MKDNKEPKYTHWPRSKEYSENVVFYITWIFFAIAIVSLIYKIFGLNN